MLVIMLAAAQRKTHTAVWFGSFLLFGLVLAGCTSVGGPDSPEPRFRSAENNPSVTESYPSVENETRSYPPRPIYNDGPAPETSDDASPGASDMAYSGPSPQVSSTWDSQPASYQNSLRADAEAVDAGAGPLWDQPMGEPLSPPPTRSSAASLTSTAPPSRLVPTQESANDVSTQGPVGPSQKIAPGNRSPDGGSPQAEHAPAAVNQTTAAQTPASRGPAVGDSPTPAPEPPAGDVTVGNDTPLEADMAAIQAQIKDLEASAEQGADQQRAATVTTLKSALSRLAIAQKSQQRTKELREQTASAPEMLRQVKAELGKPAAELRPEFPDDVSLSRLEQFLSESQQASKRGQEDLGKLEEQLKQRTDRQAQLPQLVDEAKGALEEAEKQLKSPAPSENSAAAAAARTVEVRARVKATTTQLAMYEAESARHEAVAELLPLQRDLAKRQTTQQEKLVTSWQAVVADFRKAESERQAAAAREEVKLAHPSLRDVAEENAKLAEERTAKASEIQQMDKEIESIQKQLEILEGKHAEITEKVEKVGLSATVGMLLRRLGEELPDVGDHRSRIRKIEKDLPTVQLRMMELDEQRSEMGDLDAVEQQIVSGLNGTLSHLGPEKVQKMVRQFLENKREYSDKLRSDYERYQQQLVALEVATSNLIAKSDELRGYVEEHVLWIRSAKTLGTSDLAKSAGAVRSIASWQHVKGLFGAGSERLRTRPTAALPLAGLFAIPFLLRRRIRAILDRSHPALLGNGALSFRATLEALGATVLLAAFWPGLMWCAGWWLGAQADRASFAGALGNALQVTALLGLAAELLRQMASQGGLAEAHFGWPAGSTAALRRILKVLMFGGLPLVALYVFLEDFQNQAWADSLGRLTFIGGMFLLAAALHFAARGSSGLLREISDRDPSSPLVRFRVAWHMVLVASPLALAGLAAVGYYYSAQQLALRLQITLWILLGLVILHSLVCRLLHIWEHMQADPSSDPTPRDGTTDETVEDEDELDSASITSQVRRLLGGATIAAMLVGLWLIWSQVLPALQIFNRVELWDTVVEVAEKVQHADGPATLERHTVNRPITLGHLLIAIAILSVTSIATRNLPGLLRITILDRLPMQRGGKHAVAIISRYVVAVAGIIFACQTVGMRWSSVQWLVAAMTVGLGFGLQEIFANLVSGLILLFEQPIRMGDLVTVGGLTGKVTRMQIRATTITDFDRRELVVPNKKFITDDVINWTLTDPITRVVIPIGVAYGSDTKLTHDTLRAVAQKHPLVLREPAATAVFTGFGDSTLSFELRFYLGSRDVYGQVLHEMNTSIDSAFREANLEIAFPQQDIHIRSIESVLPAVVGGQPAGAAQRSQTGQSGSSEPPPPRRAAA